MNISVEHKPLKPININIYLNPNFAIGFRIETKKAEIYFPYRNNISIRVQRQHKKVREYFNVFKDFFRSKNEGIFVEFKILLQILG